MRGLNVTYYDSPLVAHIVIASLFIVLVSVCISTNFLPTHDVIEVHARNHYFYDSIARGVIPYWSPYGQTGSPFFSTFQAGGFLIPSQFVFIFFQKITGCTTLTTYILHYFFMYYIFILGTYYTLRVITDHNMNSLLFSIVLLLASFPSFMRQYVCIFFLIPFITFFLLRFFKESRIHKKGFSLLVSSFLCAIASNRYIPIWLLFYLMLFVICVFLFKIADIKATIQFFMNRYGISWAILALLVSLLILSPVMALYYELRFDTEYFPTLRFLQKNGNNLVKIFASDIAENLFSQRFSNNMKVSETMGNLVGLLFEPFQYFWHNPLIPDSQVSEIILYVGILPLSCILIAISKVKRQYSYMFSLIAVLIFFVACNFKNYVHSPPGLTQRILMSIFPFLNMSDVLQYGGVLVLFCFIIVGALGFQYILNDRRKAFWGIIIFLPLYKSFIYLPVLFGWQFFLYQNVLLCGILFVLALFLFMQTGNFLVHPMNIKRLQQCAVVILIFDLLVFNLFHVFSLNKVLSDKYYTYLRDTNVLYAEEKTLFTNYRVAFSDLILGQARHPFYAKNSYFNTFWEYELYSKKKVAFPLVVNTTRSRQTRENYLANWDHHFMTTYYYDYLVNVKFDKQLVTSNIITPILNFFPKEDVIFVENKYKVVEQINRANLDKLRTHIFIEQDRNAHLPGVDVAQFFNRANFIRYTLEEIANFNRHLHLQYPANPDVSLNITAYDINHLSLIVDTPYDGYVYFGDGYSKHWKARVDGKDAPIEKTNINFKSVYTPAGKHRVDFIYDPVMFRYSLYVYLIGNLLFLTIFTTFLITSRVKHKKQPE